MQGKHDLGMNMNAVVKSVNVPAWSKVSSSCSITLGGKVVAAGLASHQMLFCVLKSAIPGLCWSAETLSLSDIPHIIDAICQFLSPESRTHWEQSLWISIVPGLTCSRYPADCFQLCVQGCHGGSLKAAAGEGCMEGGEGSTLQNLANQDLCKCCRGGLSLCPPLSAESWFLYIYWHTAWLCPFYFVTLAAKHCIMDLEGAW